MWQQQCIRISDILSLEKAVTYRHKQEKVQQPKYRLYPRDIKTNTHIRSVKYHSNVIRLMSSDIGSYKHLTDSGR